MMEFLSFGLWGGLALLIKFWLLIIFTDFILDESRKAIDREDSKSSIYFNAFLKCLGVSFVLSLIYLAYDGSYCTGQDMYGCYEKEYDDDFVPRTIDQTLEHFATLLTVTVAASFYRLNKII